jgi:hypothetical protein
VSSALKWTKSFIKSMARRSLIGILIAVAIVVAPIPPDSWPLAAGLQIPLGAIVVVITIGKALYDTLFFDRYQP